MKRPKITLVDPSGDPSITAVPGLEIAAKLYPFTTEILAKKVLDGNRALPGPLQCSDAGKSVYVSARKWLLNKPANLGSRSQGPAKQAKIGSWQACCSGLAAIYDAQEA
jgi:hypothetical protein